MFFTKISNSMIFKFFELMEYLDNVDFQSMLLQDLKMLSSYVHQFSC